MINNVGPELLVAAVPVGSPSAVQLIPASAVIAPGVQSGLFDPVFTVEGTAVDSPIATGPDNTTPPPGPGVVNARWPYIKVGSIVMIGGRFICIGRQLTGGVICIGGLPFAPAASLSLGGCFTARDFDTGEQCGSHLEPPGGVVQHPDKLQLEIVPLHINNKIIVNLSLFFSTDAP